MTTEAFFPEPMQLKVQAAALQVKDATDGKQWNLEAKDIQWCAAHDMIISCSRRTDIPAAYSRWLLQRLAAGYCVVPNPANPNQVTRVSLKPEDVDVIVFWSKNPAPLIPHLAGLDAQGYRYYFQFTLNGYDRMIEPNVPDLEAGIEAFRTLSRLIGSNRVIWRYDPIILSRKTDVNYHIERFSLISRALAGCTRRVVVSIVDPYRRTERGFRILDRNGYEVQRDLSRSEALGALISRLAQIARQSAFEIQSCAEEIDLRPSGVQPGKCIDDALIERAFGLRVSGSKDPSQRPLCGCVKSRDIGMYDSCPEGCRYCYATHSHAGRIHTVPRHDENSPSLLGWFDAEAPDAAGKE